jgi:hypothetical protein
MKGVLAALLFLAASLGFAAELRSVVVVGVSRPCCRSDGTLFP